MKTQAAIDHFDGSVAKLAEALRISRAAVYQWGDDVPPLRACQIHVLTGGAVAMDGADAGRVRDDAAA